MTSPQAAQTDPSAAWHAALETIEAWDRGEGSLDAVTGAVSALPDLKGRPAPTLDALRKVARRGDNLAIQTLVGPRPHGATRALRAVLRFAATQPGVSFPWSVEGPGEALRGLFDAANPGKAVSPSAVADAARDRSMTLAWLATTLAAHPRATELLVHQLMLRDRSQWLPAAVVVADALSDERAPSLVGLRLEEGAKAADAKKGGKAKGAATAGNAAEAPPRTDPEAGDVVAYTARHLAVLGTLTAIARGESFLGKGAEAWVEDKDRNWDDFSAIALASTWLAELRPDLEEPCRKIARLALSRTLTGRDGKPANPINITYQHGDSARAVIDRFGDCDEAWSVLTRPMLAATPDNTSNYLEHAADQLHDLHRSLLWLEAREASGVEVEARVASLLGGPLACARSVVAATSFHLDLDGAAGSAETWLQSLTDALRQLSPAIWDASPPLANAASLVSALILVQVPFAAGTDWQSVVAAANASWLDPSPGTTSARGWVDLAGLAATRGAVYRYLLHRPDLDHRRPGASEGLETVGLARLLRARWRVKTDPASTPKVHIPLTMNCAQQIARRLAVAKPAEASRVVLAALAADAPPPAYARLVSQKALAERERDNLWEKVRDFLPASLDRGPQGDALERLCALERAREPDTRAAEAAGYLDLISLYPELEPVRRTTAAVWETVVAARASFPPKSAGGPHTVSPDAMRAWISDQLRPVARSLVDAASAIEAALEEQLPDRGQREADRKSVEDAAHDELVSLRIPMLELPVQRRWEQASKALRRLAEPLPWCIEGQLDDLLSELDGWIALASQHAATRSLLLERIEAAIEDEDEVQLARILQDGREARLEGPASPGVEAPRQLDLIDPPRLRAISNFWLRRLRFDQNALLPREHRASRWTYYGPLLLAVLGAPLTTVQTNYIWQPIIGDPLSSDDLPSGPGTEVRFWAIMTLFFGICLNGIWQDLRRRLGGLGTGAIIRRAITPFAGLLAINYVLSFLLYLVSAERLDVWRTTFLWGTLSLYLGIFLGLFAQGARIDREEVDD